MRRVVFVVAAAVLAVAGSAPLLPGRAQGENGVYRAVANADGTRVTVSAPGYLLVNTLFDTGAPTAQAVVDGLGNSRAFASYPYPGDTVVAAPGLVKGNGGPGAL